MATTRIIFGCGYLGLRVGKLWKAAGEHTWAFTRNESRVLELGKAGLHTAPGDVTNPDSLEHLRTIFGLDGAPVESLLYAVGYDRNAGADIRSVYAGGLANVLAALPASVGRVIYISTTGVYGSAGGDWVDEQTPPDPQREGGKASLAAEQRARRPPARPPQCDSAAGAASTVPAACRISTSCAPASRCPCPARVG